MIVSSHVVQGHNSFCLRCVAECQDKARSGDKRFGDWEKIKRAAALPYGTAVVKLDNDPGGRASPRFVCVRHAKMIVFELSVAINEIESMEAMSDDG